MKAIIIEDEIVAARTLQRLIGELRPGCEILATLQTVEESVEWLASNPAPDVAFMDIQLADGSSFAIFERADVECPVIFTTAYNEYALEAFEVSGIDYLLKPINKERLRRAIEKFENLARTGSTADNASLVATLLASLNEKQNRHKTHFLVPHRDKLVPLAVNEIAYCVSELKVARAVTFSGKSFTLDYSLEELMKSLDPEQFYRVNRQYIIAHRAISDLSLWFGGKLSVNLSVPLDERIVVSKPRATEFKAWYTRELQ